MTLWACELLFKISIRHLLEVFLVLILQDVQRVGAWVHLFEAQLSDILLQHIQLLSCAFDLLAELIWASVPFIVTWALHLLTDGLLCAKLSFNFKNRGLVCNGLAHCVGCRHIIALSLVSTWLFACFHLDLDRLVFSNNLLELLIKVEVERSHFHKILTLTERYFLLHKQ